MLHQIQLKQSQHHSLLLQLASHPLQKTKLLSLQRPQTQLSIDKVLLEIVADKTGYPTDMLEMDMDLEADLGIDSIKRVEILGALQEKTA